VLIEARPRRLENSKKIQEGRVMNKDRVEGKVKDVAGRLERQAGEWTGDQEKQVQGTVKQVEGKVQNAWGNAKDAAKKAADKDRPNKSSGETTETEKDEDDVRSRRKVS
jgi:uncharacterized protein YjbJ (UPF0337 family)